MAAAVGEIIFRAGEESPDTWDDTALIAAYDKAVNPIKQGGGKNKGGGKQRKQHSTKKKETKKNEDLEPSSSGWQVGDACRAVFTEDDQVYEAVIVSIDHKAQSCVVRYNEYENEEDQQLMDLIPPSTVQATSKPAPKKQPSYRQNIGSAHQMGDWSGHSSARWQVSDICLAQEQPSGHLHEAVINSFPTACTCQVTFLRSRQRQEVNLSSLCPSSGSRSGHYPQSSTHSNYQMQAPDYYTHSAHLPGFSYPPPMWPPYQTGVCPTPSTNTNIPWPPMPPVPTPVSSSSGAAAVDEDALASMLMSWYLTGYHTGYYQGLQSVRQASETPPTNSTKEMENKTTEEDESRNQQE